MTEQVALLSDGISMIRFHRILFAIGLVSASMAALPNSCFAACDQTMSTVEESQCAQTAADKASHKMWRSLNRALAAAAKMVENGDTKVDFRPNLRESQILW
jgi:hypothetical protein